MPFQELSPEKYNKLTPQQKADYNAAKAAANRQVSEEAARERNEEVRQGAHPSGVLPQEQNMDGADQLANSYQRQGSVGGGRQTGETNQFNTQTGSSTSTSSIGDMDPKRREEMIARQKAEADARGLVYDPETGQLTPKNTFITDILGVDPAVMRKKREREQSLNRRKQKESALYNALSVLGDMITTAGGGNVWKRDADKHAKEAHDANMALDREQQAEDLSNAEKLSKVKQDAIDKINAINMQYNSLFAPREQTSSSTSNSQGTSISNSQSTKWSQSASVGKQGTTYSDALKGGGLIGRSRRSYNYRSGGGGGSSKDVDYLPIRIMNGAHGQEYYSFEIDKNEKAALSGAIARSIEDAAQRGDANAAELLKKYYTKKNRTDRTATWDYDALMNDGSLYQIPGVLNRYLDELTTMGMTHTVGNEEVPYSRTELYDMMTGDTEHKHVPAGVILGSSRL